jgi:anti-sigma regulatory factor (Ser/Thr protein kinase)
MISSATWSDPMPIRTSAEHPRPAKGEDGLHATAAPAIASPLRSSIILPGTASHIAEARRFIAGFVADRTVAADAVLCLSEVVTNAVIHSNSRDVGGRVAVRAEQYSDGFLRIEVEDQGGRWIERPKAEGQRHLGLMIVSQLASAWGIQGDGLHSRTVWFELCPVPVPASPPVAA